MSNPGCTPEYNQRTRDMMAELEKIKAQHAEVARISKAHESGDFGPVIRKAARDFSKVGESDPVNLVDRVHKYISQHAELTKEEVADAISGYGRETKPSTDPEVRKYNAMRAELRNLSRTQDELMGKSKDPQIARDAGQRTKLRNEIAELNRQIDYGADPTMEQAKRATPADIQALRNQRDAKFQELENTKPAPEAIYPKDPNEAYNQREQNRAKNRMDDLRERIANLDASEKATPNVKPNQETLRLREELKQLEREHKNLRPAPEAIYPRTDPRVAARIKDLQKQTAAMQAKIASRDASRPPPRQPHEYTDPRVLDALMERNMARNQFENFLAKGDRMGRNSFQKVLGIVHDVQMASILASLHVFKKLAYAVGGGHTLSLLADATRSAAKAVIPGVKGIAADAPRYGEGLSWGAMKARWQGITEAPKEAVNQIRYGQATREAAFGNPSRMSDEFMTHVGTMSEALHTPGLLNKVAETTRQAASYIGRTHAAEKEFLVQPGFRESLYRRSVAMARELKRQGMTAEQAAEVMGRESTQAGLGALSVMDAYEDKMQGKNKLSSAVDAAIGTLDRSKNAGDNFLGFVAKTLFPIRKIGVNVAIQGSSLLGGGVKALAAAMKGTEGLSKADRAARADYIMKNIGQQGAGAALLTAGILYYDKFGGVPGVFTKKQAPQQKDADGNPIPAGESSFSGSEAFHGAPFAMMQIGASMAQVFKKEQGKDGVTRALDVALKPTSNWFVRTVPYLDTPRRWINTAEYGRGRTEGLTGAVSEITGDTLRGMVMPGVVQQKARDDDPYKGFRKPRNIKEDIETGIPGLRENVPIR